MGGEGEEWLKSPIWSCFSSRIKANSGSRKFLMIGKATNPWRALPHSKEVGLDQGLHITMWDLPPELRFQTKIFCVHCSIYVIPAAPCCVQLFTFTKHLNIFFAALYTPGCWTGCDVIPKLWKRKLRRKKRTTCHSSHSWTRGSQTGLTSGSPQLSEWNFWPHRELFEDMAGTHPRC